MLLEIGLIVDGTSQLRYKYWYWHHVVRSVIHHRFFINKRKKTIEIDQMTTSFILDSFTVTTVQFESNIPERVSIARADRCLPQRNIRAWTNLLAHLFRCNEILCEWCTKKKPVNKFPSDVNNQGSCSLHNEKRECQAVVVNQSLDENGMAIL